MIDFIERIAIYTIGVVIGIRICRAIDWWIDRREKL